ncbi:hypothetical protein CesoFtcFv8_027616 [Champsocephalus esox]|uniref:Aryl hydrocarbon receptor 1b n=1 Tax=Champsocephalus esox TaxID=159716 RepID=A0AAN7Y3D9_9TELE|nr:hypothetical protein CesoFtcFv8_027616 [Champsocephalus esox]
MYAVRKRRKPAQKGAKPAPAESTKSNPSKRHRDRLNSELDRLASLLPFPQDVVSSLDKLSILRLSVSFLRTKNFFSVTLKNQLKKSSDEGRASDGHIPEGELLLQALNGFVMVVTADGTVFFCSHTIHDYLGFHQTDVMHQSVFELIHTEDQQEFRSNLHWALNPPQQPRPPPQTPQQTYMSYNWMFSDGESGSSSSCLVSYTPEQLPPENSSFLERGFVVRFRCLLDNSSGFLALNIQGRLKFLHGQSGTQSHGEGSTPHSARPLDFTPMACDAKGKIVLGYTEVELRARGSGYQFIHAADMLYCAENHVRMMKTGESGLTVFRLLTKENRWKWVQANARLVYKSGKPDYIIATQRPLVEEEGGEHLRKRSMHLPFTFATGEAMLYQTGYPLHGFPDAFQGKSRGSKSKKGKLDKSSSEDQDPKGLLGALMSQDTSVYVCQPDPEPRMSCHSGFFSQQQDGEGFGGLMGGDSWSLTSNVEMGGGITLGYDPLLTTLDSLSIDGEETCSNSELFSALENLGLNAEDLELLLLDERMMQVELGPHHVPSLSDLLSNNEILSYIQDSLESGTEGDSAQPGSQQAALPPAAPPIMHLSQQMQQHISAGKLGKAAQITADSKTLTNGHWNHHHHHTAPKASHLNGGHKHQPDSSQQWQLQQPSLHLHFQNQLPTNGSYITNGHSAFPPNVEAGYNGVSALNGVSSADVCHYQSLHSLQTLEAYSMFNGSTQDSTHSKLENGCLLAATNAGYIRTCLMPNGNGVTTHHLPDPLPALPDPQKSGFFL